jgi:DNA-binding CsgD family transcriptional regulator
MPFNTIARSLLDNWLSAEDPKPDDIYRDVISKMSVRMRLTVIDVSAEKPEDWELRPVRQTRLSTRILNLDALFKAGRFADFKDQEYLNTSVIPQYRQVLDKRQPMMDTVDTKLLGIRISYDRILLPEKSKARPSWLVTCTYGRFMASAPANNLSLDNIDETILLHVMAGETAKEIAAHTNLSHRTVEHRLERLRKQVGARTLPQLVSMLIVAGFGRSINFSSDGRLTDDS